MRTAEKILNASILLFNREGLRNVALRDIATHLGISLGNLTYHYAKKELILEDIYTQMDAEMEDAVFPGHHISLVHYDQLLNRISQFQKRYEFFYMDILEITRQYPHIIARYRKTIVNRQRQYNRLVHHYIEKGLFREEPGPGFYQALFHSIWVMSTFWLQQKKVLGSGNPVVRVSSDTRQAWQILLPYLTYKGLQEFEHIMSTKEGAEFMPTAIEKVFLDQLNN